MQLLRGNKQQIEWRRSQVLELGSKGHYQSEILQVDKSSTNRDIDYLREQSKPYIDKITDQHSTTNESFTRLRTKESN